jgi:ABC-type multidrug transport system ATPase subunit/RsiW-degrading membrane proteinase PrsW (M82 family)
MISLMSTDINFSSDNRENKKSVFLNHLHAIFFRRFVLFKRSWKTTLFSTIATLFFTSLAIIAQMLIASLVSEENKVIDFNSFGAASDIILVVGSQAEIQINIEYLDIINAMYFNDTGRYPSFLNFSTREEMNEYLYNCITTKTGVQSYPMGIYFNANFTNYPLFFNGTVGYSGSNTTQPLFVETILGRILFYKKKNSDFQISFVKLTKRILEKTFSAVGPMLIAGGLLSTIPILISQPIIDTVGEVRDYMVSCTLTLLPYWLATFILDMVLWIFTAFVVWAMFLICRIQAFLDNKFITWYVLTMSGPAFILFLYCISFFFNSPESASRNVFIILCLLLVIPVVTDVVRDFEPNPIWYEWLMAVFPFTPLQRQSMYVLKNMGFLVQPFSFYWKDKNSQPFFIMQIGNIPIYAIILCIIEKARNVIKSKHAKKTFGDYQEFFENEKRRHPVTNEAKEMEDLVETENNFAVKIKDVSRLFFNTAGEPVAAVNGVSLGVRKNSIFGFLGANGAGKTTLIKMITSMLPPSSGTIEINGIDIEENKNSRILSICPQFNSHLFAEMTPNEHFYMYSLIHLLDEDEAKESIEKLINELDMRHLADTPLREQSGGDQRKLAIALSFLGPAKIILLDEPTASLDPFARHKVHDLILSYKGQKTFMLCTHLLSEAEFLCDMISIMVKGCVYTCGTSQHLTQKFGTDYKIDVMLKDDSVETELKCDEFFREKLPAAKLSIKRPKARIYSIPATDRPLSQLFGVMQEGEDSDSGIVYFTCSSSSLERVFMEIIHMSERDDIIAVGHKP